MNKERVLEGVLKMRFEEAFGIMLSRLTLVNVANISFLF